MRQTGEEVEKTRGLETKPSKTANAKILTAAMQPGRLNISSHARLGLFFLFFFFPFFCCCHDSALTDWYLGTQGARYSEGNLPVSHQRTIANKQ